jgi:glutathione S-transferase
LAEKYRLYDSYLGKMERVLANQAWLAGDTFSLADIAMTDVCLWRPKADIR